MKFMLIYSLALWNGYGKQFLQEAFLQEDVLAVSIGKRFVKGDLTLKHSLCSHFKISHNLNILIYYNKSIWIEFFYDFSQRMVFSLGHNG